MTREEIIEQLNLAIGLIKQDGKDWLDNRDIPMLEECIKALSQEPSRNMEEIAEVIKSDVDAETKCKMISNILTAKPHYFEKQTTQDKQAESEKYQKAFDDGYANGYAQARFDYEQEPCDDAISRILKRMWNCRGKHTTSIDKVKMEQIIRDELPFATPQTECLKAQAKKQAIPMSCDDCCYEPNSPLCEMYRKDICEKKDERQSGKWTLMYEPKNMAVCSECGKCAYMYQDKTSAFCPNCGAKMESEE